MKTLIVVLCLMILASTMVAQVSDNFLVGCYSYMKAWPDYSAFHDSIIGYLRNANYNCTMFETNDPVTTYTNGLINRLGAQGIDSYLCDYHWDQDLGTGDITSGTHAISTGNMWLFEAEYDSDNPNHPNEDAYFYKFNYSGRTGSYSLDGIRNVWRCNAEGVSADTPGVALKGLKYRWRNYEPGYDASTSVGEYTIGGEFKFAAEGENSPQSLKYMQNNKLYLKYLIRVDDGTSTSPELTFACKFLNKTLDANDNPVFSWIWVPLKNVLTTSSPANTVEYSCAELRSDLYTVAEDPYDPNLYRYITFEVDFDDLLSNNCISWTYWFAHLYAIDPFVYWKGGHTVYIDNVEVKDKMYETLETQTAEVLSWLSGRQFPNASRLYTFDEPSQPQFKALQNLNGGNGEAAILSDTKAISTISAHGQQMKKPDGTRYSHPALYMDIAGPSELLVDYYALNPQDNWNIAAMQDPISGEIPTLKNTMQWNLDWGALQHYRKLRKDTLDPNTNRKLYVVPPTFGRWDPSNSKWTTFQYPTPKMAKCLQLLPLCFGVDGVFNYYLYNPIADPSNPSIIPWPNDLEFDPLDGQNREARYLDNQYSLLDVYNHDPQHINSVYFVQTPQYAEICEANAKLHTYGNIIQNATAPLSWMDSATIGGTGLFLSPYAYEDESITATNWDMYLNSLFVQSSTAGFYSGYVQCGFYEDTDDRPWYMLVNRRTDYSICPSGTLESTPVTDLRNGSGYTEALPQVVNFKPNFVSADTFGSCPGLYDPFDGSVYTQTELGINVPIDAGDGKLLQMCSSLPSSVSSNSVVKTVAYLSGSITINTGVDVTIQSGTITRILNDSSIYIDNGASLTIRGSFTADDNVRIEVAPNGSLVFEDATCYWGQGSTIEVNGGSLTINGGSMDKSACSSRWVGFRVANSSQVTINNAIISNAFWNRITDSDCLITDSSIMVPANSIGLIIENTVPGYQTNIINTIPNRGFYGSSIQSTVGISLGVMHNQAYICNVDFQNLNKGVFKHAIPYTTDSIAQCRFVNCITGISLFYNENGFGIQQCSFANTQTGKQGTGIHLVASSPTISTCNFTNLYRGVLTEFSLISGFGIESSVNESNFYNCEMGIESKSSNHRLKANYFNRNNSGIVNHAGSNLNLSFGAHNVMMNHNDNILFYDTMPYESTIQLFTGHNDFYHLTDTSTGISAFDFSFDSNYYNFPIMTDFKINASKNWFQDDQVTFNDPAYVDYVYVDLYDPSPSMPAPPPESDRLFIALGYECQALYELAGTTYKEIIDEQLVEEKTYVTSAIDGLYRCTMMIPNPAWQLTDYFDTKALQYAIDDPTLSAILKDYLAKVFVLNKDFQAAVDLIQIRIDNPISEIDSLRAVLDLEIVLQLAAMEEDKRPLTTKYAQYQYPDIIVFDVMHSNNWDKYNRALRQNDQETNSVIAPTPQIQSNYPNPFNPSTTIAFSIPETGRVRVSVYNIKGQKVKDLLNTEMTRGTHRLVWDGKDANSRNVASGIYFIKLESGGKTSIHKGMMMK